MGAVTGVLVIATLLYIHGLVAKRTEVLVAKRTEVLVISFTVTSTDAERMAVVDDIDGEVLEKTYSMLVYPPNDWHVLVRPPLEDAVRKARKSSVVEWAVEYRGLRPLTSPL